MGNHQFFSDTLDQEEFIRYLTEHGIYEPFKFAQMKFILQAPIDLALTLVYEPTASVNEYSGRYSKMLESSVQPNPIHIPERYKNDTEKEQERVQKIVDTFNRGRQEVYENYKGLLDLDMARELARSGLGIDNDTRFYWKIDMFSLAEFVLKNGKKEDSIIDHRYIKAISDTAREVAPYTWDALMNKTSETPERVLKMPTDDEIVDSSLSIAGWESKKTRRVTVPALEEVLFKIKTFLDHGEFQVIDYMGDDSEFARAARTSYGRGTKKIQDDKNLVKSLIRDLHTSPIEMSELAFETKAPVFVDPRQFGRHRTLDNHGFMGYTPIGSQFYYPPNSEFKHQDRLNRQGRGKDMDPKDRKVAKNLLLNTYESEIQTTNRLRKLGAPEFLVRRGKGVGFYTKRSRTGDSHNLNHCLMLRLDPHAQKEIRDLAELVNEAHKLHTPVANAALHNYIINGMRLSEKEIYLIKKQEFMRQDINLESLDTYKGVGFVIRDKDTGKQKLGREGLAFKKKLELLLET